MPYADVRAAFARVRAADRRAGQRLLFELLVLPAVRTARGARWPEVDFEAALWTVLAERMEERRTYRVPLFTAAPGVLREALHHPDLDTVRRDCGAPDLIFPTRSGRAYYDNALPNPARQLGNRPDAPRFALVVFIVRRSVRLARSPDDFD